MAAAIHWGTVGTHAAEPHLGRPWCRMGSDKLFQVTGDASKVTCQACLKRGGAE